MRYNVQRLQQEKPILADMVANAKLRVVGAVQARYPPWSRRNGFVRVLTLVVVDATPNAPGDDDAIAAALTTSKQRRAVPLALFRVDLQHETLSFALRDAAQLAPEVGALADELCLRLQRYVPLIVDSA